VLTAQDAQRWKPPVTVQNMVPAENAKSLHRELSASFAPREGGHARVRYLGRVAFTGSATFIVSLGKLTL
jgi:hypothetical protein